MQHLDIPAVKEQLNDKFGEDSFVGDAEDLVINAVRLTEIAAFLRNDTEYQFDYLNSVTGVDYKTHFSVIYHLTSLTLKHRLEFRVDINDRNQPAVPSVTTVWRGADLQEREIYDLFGIDFTGHPKLKRIFMWEGFPGYPLRKDWVSRDA